MSDIAPLPINQTASRQEEELFLLKTFRSVHRDRHSLFLASTYFYNQLATDQGLVQNGLEICRWLGIKPHRISVSYSDQQSTDPYVIFIHPDLQMLPYHAGFALSKGVIRLLLAQKHFDAPTDSLIEHAMITLGLHVITLNAIGYKETAPEHWYRLVKHHHISLPRTLNTYSTQSYIDAATLYCKHQEIDLKTALPYLHKNARELLPRSAVVAKTKHPQTPTYTLRRRKIATKALFKFATVSLFISIVVASGMYLWQQQPQPIPAALLVSQQKLDQLEQSYATCTHTARQQINNYQGDDIFTERRIDEVLTECQSIKNQYNYEALQYNSLLKNR